MPFVFTKKSLSFTEEKKKKKKKKKSKKKKNKKHSEDSELESDSDGKTLVIPLILESIFHKIYQLKCHVFLSFRGRNKEEEKEKEEQEVSANMQLYASFILTEKKDILINQTSLPVSKQVKEVQEEEGEEEPQGVE